MFRSSRSRPLVFLLLVQAAAASLAQQVIGRLPPPTDDPVYIRLHATIGGTHPILDSVLVAADGSFSFDRAARVAGFYQLAIGTSDRVDLLIDPSESLIDMTFLQRPIQEHVVVNTSAENRRLWTYKYVSRSAQQERRVIEEHKSRLRPFDLEAIAAADSALLAVDAAREAELARLVAESPNGTFAKIVSAGKALEVVRGASPMTVHAVFPFDDGILLRSTLYPEAVMTFLRNVNPMDESQLIAATDTLIRLASGDADCQAFMSSHLLELFATYGPDRVVQHLLDRHFGPERPLDDLPAAVRDKVIALRQVAVGAVATDLELARPGASAVRLSELVAGSTHLLLFFYSSTCDHCHEQMPGLKMLYGTYAAKGLQIVGIALDDDARTFFDTLQQRDLPWPATSALKGWGCPAAKAFAVGSTPAMILLDKRLRIVAKPYDHEELAVLLQGLLP